MAIIDELDSRCVEEAHRRLQRGEVVIVPTDTVYGLAVDAANAQAVEELFKLKRRPVERGIAVLVSDLTAAEKLVKLHSITYHIAQTFWPGPLTLVAERTEQARFALPHLGIGNTLGVRVPNNDLVRQLAKGQPLAVTSANFHGEPTPYTSEALAQIFPSVGLIVNGNASLPGVNSSGVNLGVNSCSSKGGACSTERSLCKESSTVVDVTGMSPVLPGMSSAMSSAATVVSPVLLRAGPITIAQIMQCIKDAQK